MTAEHKPPNASGQRNVTTSEDGHAREKRKDLAEPRKRVGLDLALWCKRRKKETSARKKADVPSRYEAQSRMIRREGASRETKTQKAPMGCGGEWGRKES